MALQADGMWWRKAAAIVVLPFAALGVAGCDNAETGGEEVEQEAPAGEGGEVEQEAPAGEGSEEEEEEEEEEG